MSTFRYGSITLPYARVHTFAQQSISDPSGTDWMLLSLDMTVTAVINTNYASLVGVTGSNAADMMKNMRTQLLKRRQQIQYTFNGVDIIPPKPTGNLGNVDANNGPVPQYCHCTLLTDDTFMVDYRIQANYWEDVNATPANNVLSNRWSERVSIDKHNYSTFTRNGTYVIRSDNPAGMSAEGVTGATSSAGGFREQYATLGIRPGCIRQHADYTVDPTGLRMSYNISDKEVFLLPPEPAFEATGTYTETSPGKTNAKRHVHCQLTMWGSKTTEVAALVRTAVLACSSKIRAGAAARQAQVVLTNGSVQMGMWENRVSVSMHGILYVTQNQGAYPIFGGMAGINYNTLMDTISTRGANPPPHAIRGTAGIVLRPAVYFDPSLKQTLLSTTGQMTPGKVPGTVGKQGA